MHDDLVSRDQLVTRSTCHEINLSRDQLVTRSTCHEINLSRDQLNFVLFCFIGQDHHWANTKPFWSCSSAFDLLEL